MVGEDSRGFKAVAYSRLVPILASALSAALDRLDKLERSVAVGAAAALPPSIAGGDAATKHASAHVPILSNSTIDLTAMGKQDGYAAGDGGGASESRHAASITKAKNIPLPTKRSDAHHSANGVAATPAASRTDSKGNGGSAGRQHRSVAEVGARGQQAEGGALLDRMQLWVENTGLRGRISELEERMFELERRLGSLVG